MNLNTTNQTEIDAALQANEDYLVRQAAGHFYDAGIDLSDAEFDEAEDGYLEGLEG